MQHRRPTSVLLMIGLATAVALALTATRMTASRDLGREVLASNDGWASFDAGTTGGSAADAGHVYVVTNRQELVAAVGNRSTVPKIIYVKGVIDANVDDNNQPLTCADYQRSGYTLEAYLAAYDPAVWGKTLPTGPLEAARVASKNAQQDRVRIKVGSNTTIVGFDRQATIKGAWLDLGSTSSSFASNVIIRNLRLVDTFDCFPQWDPTDGSSGNWNAAYDNISVKYGNHVWIDHNEFADIHTADSAAPTYFGRHYEMHDGQLDITNGANYVTVSWNRFTDHDKVMLIGSSDSGSTATLDRGKLKVTIHHNVFDNVVQRTPRVRFGQVHVYNNLYRVRDAANYGYSWGVGIESAIYAEDNLFRVDQDVAAADFIEVSKGTAINEQNTLVDAASFKTHSVDVVDAYNAVHDPDLAASVAWTPTLFLVVDRASRVQGLTSSGSGTFDWYEW